MFTQVKKKLLSVQIRVKLQHFRDYVFFFMYTESFFYILEPGVIIAIFRTFSGTFQKFHVNQPLGMIFSALVVKYVAKISAKFESNSLSSH